MHTELDDTRLIGDDGALLASARPPTERITDFCAYLREAGYEAGSREAMLMLEVLALGSPLRDMNAVARAWKPIACKNRRQVANWNDVFMAFWAPHRVRGTVKVTGSTRQTRNLKQLMQSLQQPGAESSEPRSGQSGQSGDVPGLGEDDVNAGQPKASGGASQTDPMDDRSGQQWMPADITALEQLARRVKRQLQPQPTRRWQIQPRGRRLHPRQTLRESGRLMGEGIIPAWKGRRTEQPNLVILCDVSRSMEAYAALSLRVARAFSRVLPVRTFVFHVRMNEVSDLLRRDTPRVQERINAVTAGFQAGTRIAHCIRQISQGQQRVVLGRGTRLWIFSDGYDTDPPEQLAGVLRKVRGRGGRIAWFYPNAERPASTAVKLASDAVDQWVPAANFELIKQHASVLR